MKEKIKPSEILFLYNSKLGHITHHVRGKIFQNFLQNSGWHVSYIDESTSTLNEILSAAASHKIIYCIKVANYDIYWNIKINTSSIIIFDCIDALWLPSFKESNWGRLEEILSLCDAIITENQWAGEYLAKFSKPIFYIPVVIPRIDANTHKITGDKVVMGWIGSNSTAHSLSEIAIPLIDLLNEFPDLELRILGGSSEIFHGKCNQKQIVTLRDYDESLMLKNLHEMHIGLFPPPDTLEEYKIRGGQKTFIYMASGVVPVCLNAGDSLKFVVDNFNGILINSKEEWYTKLKRAITEQEKLMEMGLAARNSMLSRFTLQSTYNLLEDSLLKVTKLS